MTSPSPAGASAGGGGSIVDAGGNTWTFGAIDGNGNAPILINGNAAGKSAASLYWNGTSIFAGDVWGGWFQFVAAGQPWTPCASPLPVGP
jgi:hypothetical protein